MRWLLVDADDKPLVDAHILDLGRVVGEEAPWPTLSDNRIGPGAEVTIDATFEVSQKTRSPTAALRLRIQRVVGEDISDPMLERRIPLRLL